MAESNSVKSQDGLEDSIAAEEWTIIDKKESKDDDESADAENGEKVDGAEKIAAPRETHHATGDSPTKESHIEECPDASEKDFESDDISIISEESEAERAVGEEGRIQTIEEWQVERSQALQLKSPSHSSGNPISNILIACSVVILILGVMYATMGELKDIEGKLKELNDVKQALDRMKLSMPDIKRLEDESQFQRYRSKYEVDEEDNFDRSRIQNILSTNSINDRLEMLEITHQNLCSTIGKINSSNSVFGDICKTPKILSDMITFKKNLKRAHEKTKGTTSPDKRFFSLLEEKLDYVSESLLAEVSVIFLKFSGKITDRLSKFGHRLDRMYAQLCSSKNSGDRNDEFLNAFLNEDFQRKICKGTNNQDQFINENPKLNKTSRKKKSRNYNMSPKLNAEDVPNKNKRELRKPQGPENNSKEKFKNQEFDHFQTKGEVTSDEEWKKDNYKQAEAHHDQRKKYEKFNGKDKNGYEHRDERHHELRKESSHPAPASETKQNYSKPKHARDENLEYNRQHRYGSQHTDDEDKDDDSGEKFHHTKNGRKKDKDSEKFESKNFSDREFEREKDARHYDRDTHKYGRKNSVNQQTFDDRSREKTVTVDREENLADRRNGNDFNVQYGPNNQDSHSQQRHPAHKFERDNGKYRQKNSRSDGYTKDHRENSKENEIHHFEDRFNNNKQNFESKYDRRNYKIYDDSKITNNWEDEGYESSGEAKSTHRKNKEYLPRSDSFKESNHMKLRGNDRKYKNFEHDSEGDWQIKRGEAREQMRNSEKDNWFLDRADSRKWARRNEPHPPRNQVPPSPPPRQEPYRNERQNSWRGDDRPPVKKRSFKNRVMDKIGSTFRSLGLL